MRSMLERMVVLPEVLVVQNDAHYSWGVWAVPGDVRIEGWASADQAAHAALNLARQIRVLTGYEIEVVVHELAGREGA